MVQKILAWTCLGCAVVFAAVAAAAVFAGDSVGVGAMIYTGVAVAVIAILSAVGLIVVGRLE